MKNVRMFLICILFSLFLQACSKNGCCIYGVVYCIDSYHDSRVYLPEATLELYLNGQIVAATKSDANAFYRFDKLRKKTDYVIHVSHQQHFNGVSDNFYINTEKENNQENLRLFH